jgi:hypothetical protein
MNNSIRTEIYSSEIYQSRLVLIGVLHRVNPEELQNNLEDLPYKFDIILFESGAGSGLDPDSVNEHKALDEYRKKHNVKIESCDVKGINDLVKKDLGELDPGFSKEKVKQAVYREVSLDPSADNFHKHTKKELAKIESNYPNIYEFFVVLRNMKMSQELDKALEKHNTVGLIVGCGHIPGIVERMDKI